MGGDGGGTRECEALRPPAGVSPQYSEMPAGGHFAALEQPELLAKEVLKFGDLARAKGWL